MINQGLQEELKESTKLILGCGQQIGLMKAAVDRMYAVYCALSDININNQNDENIYLASGKAISPSQAAHCLLEMVRTAKFLRGIDQAITDLLNNSPSLPIQILYAGTGPFATLLTPLLLLYDSNKIRVDLLDINSISLDSAKAILKQLGLFSFVDEVICADASSFKIEKSYKLIISETMQAALKKEPQVAIMQNLIRQSKPDMVFIPESITLSMALTSNTFSRDTVDSTGHYSRVDLGEVFTVSKHSLNTEHFRKVLRIPESLSSATQLKVYTEINIYGNHRLIENECSLNLPVKVTNVDGSEGDDLECRYVMGGEPHIECRLRNTRPDWIPVGLKTHRMVCFQYQEEI